ncbi:phage tail protein [Streptomyces crystallinus]|uniref:Phage tail protein n=1 Tax=Streptomyces crystallinus TaxID=68191 RepID=A0ABP3Q8I4_9ACTN
MSLDDGFPSYRFSVSLGRYAVESVRSVSGLGAARCGDVVVVRGTDRSREFTDWVASGNAAADGGALRQNVRITEYDARRRPVHTYHLSNAWARQWDAPAPDADGTDTAEETVTIRYEDMTVE